MHSDADVDGDTLVELTEKQNAADFKRHMPSHQAESEVTAPLNRYDRRGEGLS